jgi:class 3 adenylate cyclase
MSDQAQIKIYRSLLGFSLIIATIYVMQGYLIRYRLEQLESTRINLEKESEVCNDENCVGTWNFVTNQRFLLLGQIVRSYKILTFSGGQEILPINEVQGTASDAWSRLRVYKVDPGSRYKIVAKKPKATRLNYFMGILPRSTDHEGVLSIPTVGPTISGLATAWTFFTLIIVFSAAVISKGSSSDRAGSGKNVLERYLGLCILIAIATCTSLGTFDSLFPEGDVRNKIIRISTVASLSVLLMGDIRFTRRWHNALAAISIIALSMFLGNAVWPWLRGGATWAAVLGATGIAGIIHFLRNRDYLPAMLWGSAIFDACKILGVFRIMDHPPLYLFNLFGLLAITIVVGRLGGFETIALAARAYRRFKRDLLIEAMKTQIASTESSDSSKKIIAMNSLLSEIAEFTGAGRVALAINLPLGRPIILSFDKDSGQTNVNDDGTIPGAVTIRTVLYGDSAYYESFFDFCDKRGLPVSKVQLSAKIFCAIPIRVNEAIIGSMMLTKFDDKKIESRIRAEQSRKEEVENLNIIASGVSAAMAQLMVEDLDKTAIISKQLHAAIHREISISNDVDDFISRFVGSLALICGVQVAIHEDIGGRGVLKAEAGLGEFASKFLSENTLNLSLDAKRNLGPTVVAFRDGKSSFITDFRQIKESLHPKTVEIFDLMGVQSLAAVPFRSSERSFAVTVFTTDDTSKTGPFILAVIESAEALFLAAVNVMMQKSTTAALGALSNRLIGDPEVRNKIVDAAKLKSLPTTIGNAKVSFLFLIDLVGSSDLSHDAENKAKAYGRFYDEVNRMANQLLSATIRKTIGDAVIVTWDGSETELLKNKSFLAKLESLALYADEVANKIGCRGARCILHHGKYFLGLVGTETFGQIDVIGSGIDEVCKMEGLMKTIKIGGQPAKIAISANAVEHLEWLFREDFVARRFCDVNVEPSNNLNIRFAATLEKVKTNVA